MTTTTAFLDAAVDAHRVYALDGRYRPVETIALGDVLGLTTLDASGDQIRPGMTDSHELDPSRLFPATGPVAIDGVHAGDGVAIDVLSIVPADRGHVWTRPGLGFGPSPDFFVRELDSRRPVLRFRDREAVIPRRVHVGTLGLAPAEETAVRDLGLHGGNLDTVQLAEGATLHLRAQADGGGLFAADVHAAMADAEICGTGVEVPARLRLRVRACDGWAPTLPTIVRAGRVWLLGVGDTLDDALERAVITAVTALQQIGGLSHEEAYLACGVLLEVQVCQVVNPHRSVAVSLSGGLDRDLIPPEVWVQDRESR